MANINNKILFLIVIGTILVLSFSSSVESRMYKYTLANGDWNNGSTWDLGVVPTNGEDDINIGHVVSIVGDYHVNASSLNISGGTLNLRSNETAKLNVSGQVLIGDGGTINLGDQDSPVGGINVLSGGHLNSTLGTLNITGNSSGFNNFTNSGRFTHNAGRVIFGDALNKQYITGDNETTFFNVNATKNVTQVQNITIEGILEIPAGGIFNIDSTAKHMYLTLGNASGGHSAINMSANDLAIINAILNLTGSNPVTIRGANAMHQPTILVGTLFYKLTNQAALNLKWIHLFFLAGTNVTNLNGAFINVTGNISLTGTSTGVLAGPRSANSINITQPGTNLSVGGIDIDWKNVNTTNIIGSASSPIYISGTKSFTIGANSGGNLKIQHIVFTAAARGIAVYTNNTISPAPSSAIIDNISANATNPGATIAALDIMGFNNTDIILSNISYLDVPAANQGAYQINVNDSNVTCISCNITKVALVSYTGYFISINATNANTGTATNNTYFWGVAHSNSLNSTFGANLGGLAGTLTNLTLLSSYNAFGINTTLVVAESATLGNITIGNGTFLNITSGTLTSNSNLNVNGTVTVSNGAALNATTNASVYSQGIMKGTGTFNLNNLDIRTGGNVNASGATYNITGGNLTNAGTFTQSSGTTRFGGSTAQHIKGTNVFAFATLETGGSGSSIVIPNISVTTLNIRDGAELNISAGNITFTNSRTLTLYGKLNILDGMIINATYDSTNFTINASNVYLAKVATIPADATDINGIPIENVAQFLNITNLTGAPIMDLNITYADSDIQTANENEPDLDIYKFNNTDSKWYSTNANLNTTTNLLELYNYTFVGSIFAVQIQNPYTSLTTAVIGGASGGTTDISSTTNQQTSILTDITQGEETTVTNQEGRIPISEITFKSDTSLQGIIITIETFDDVKPDFLGELDNVYDYLKVSVDELFRLEEAAKIKFEVTKEWLKLNKLDKQKIKLFIWEDEAWRELDTILLAEDESVIEYQSLSDDIDAYFAISLASAEEAGPEGEDVFNGKLTSPSELGDSLALRASIVSIIIAALAYVAYTSYNIKPKRRRVEARTRPRKQR